jgi:hypothetical protein
MLCRFCFLQNERAYLNQIKEEEWGGGGGGGEQLIISKSHIQVMDYYLLSNNAQYWYQAHMNEAEVILPWRKELTSLFLNMMKSHNPSA